MATVQSQTARLNYLDSDERLGQVDFPLGSDPATIAADFLTAVDALAATSADDGTGGAMNMAGLEYIDLVVRIVPASIPNATMGDIRLGWELEFPAAGNKRTVPGRSSAGSLTSAESDGEFADKTQTAVTDFYDALIGVPPAGIGAVDPDDDSSPSLGNLGIRAVSTRRKRR